MGAGSGPNTATAKEAPHVSQRRAFRELSSPHTAHDQVIPSPLTPKAPARTGEFRDLFEAGPVLSGNSGGSRVGAVSGSKFSWNAPRGSAPSGSWRRGDGGGLEGGPKRARHWPHHSARAGLSPPHNPHRCPPVGAAATSISPGVSTARKSAAKRRGLSDSCDRHPGMCRRPPRLRTRPRPP